ncbi:MAG: lamin tail domain-containing protein [Deltaproteobacteria bacterium]|nr:lamin tail domain-containing protein [Deltaproteobacteria bacterium]
MVVARLALSVVAACVFAVACGRGIVDPDLKHRDKEAIGPTNEDPPGPSGPSGPEKPVDPITTCDSAPKAAPSGEACAFDAGGKGLAIHANIITPAGLLKGGKLVLGQDGKIVCAACDCDTAGAALLSCPDAVVSPGLINSHDHLKWSNMTPKPHGQERFDHRHDWRKGLRGHHMISSAGSAEVKESHSLGELRFVMTGATSSVSSTTGPGFLRNLDDKAMEGLTKDPVQYETFPLSDTKGKILASGCGYDGFIGPRAGFSAYYPHIAEGIDAEAHNEFNCLSATDGGGRDFVGANTSIIHGIGLDLKDAMTMAADGSSLVWSARTNVDLYGYTASVTVMHRAGVNIALGTDWLLSGSMNLGREFACVDRLNKTQYGGYFTDKQLVDMATANAAKAAHMDDVIGTLEAGKVADVAMFAGGAKNFRAVIEAEPKDTLLVLRGGVPLYGDQKVLDALGMTETDCEALDVCGSKKRACVHRESGKSLADLKTAASHDYDLFNCGVPQGEPSCVPFRAEANDTIRFTGEAQKDDLDGDGVKDKDDKCPSVFDPPRPMDATGPSGPLTQDDFDNDGEGDACDVCPIDPDSEACAKGTGDDRDSDTIKDADDNCPAVKNTDQADQDGDKKGDACDACPDAANPGAQGCPATIYAIKSTPALQGQAVRLNNVLVTAKGTGGFYVAHVSGDAAYTSVNDSGLFIFSTQATVAGDRVSFDGTVDKFHEQYQLKNVQNFAKATSGNPLPAATVVSTTEVAPGGSKVKLEGTLVALTGALSVASVNGTRFVVTASGKSLGIGTQLYTLSPTPSVGQAYTSATGILRAFDQTMEISIRTAADMVSGGPPPPPPPGSGTPLVIAEILTNPGSTDEGFEWVKIYNPSTVDADLSQYEIRWGGETDYSTGKVTLTGTLGAKKCVLVHEGQSSANNGNPSVTTAPAGFISPLLRNFGGTSAGLQNAASTGVDAVAIFKASVTDIPVDVVTYIDATNPGTPMASGFMGSNGQDSPVLVFTPDSASNRSFLRTSMTAWSLTAAGATTPNVCPTFAP